MLKKKNVLPLVDMVKKTLFRTIAVGVAIKTVAIEERDWTQL